MSLPKHDDILTYDAWIKYITKDFAAIIDKSAKFNKTLANGLGNFHSDCKNKVTPATMRLTIKSLESDITTYKKAKEVAGVLPLFKTLIENPLDRFKKKIDVLINGEQESDSKTAKFEESAIGWKKSVATLKGELEKLDREIKFIWSAWENPRSKTSKTERKGATLEQLTPRKTSAESINTRLEKIRDEAVESSQKLDREALFEINKTYRELMDAINELQPKIKTVVQDASKYISAVTKHVE